MDFSKFDNAIDTKAIEEAKNNPQSDFKTPAGNYLGAIEKMELGATKDGRPMFKVQVRIKGLGETAGDTEREYLKHFKDKKPCVFMNRVLYGTKNDANMIASVLGWLEKLEPTTEPQFKNYSQFADNVLDIFEEVADSIEFDFSYDDNAFNSITVTEVYDVD